MLNPYRLVLASQNIELVPLVMRACEPGLEFINNPSLECCITFFEEDPNGYRFFLIDVDSMDSFEGACQAFERIRTLNQKTVICSITNNFEDSEKLKKRYCKYVDCHIAAPLNEVVIRSILRHEKKLFDTLDILSGFSEPPVHPYKKRLWGMIYELWHIRSRSTQCIRPEELVALASINHNNEVKPVIGCFQELFEQETNKAFSCANSILVVEDEIGVQRQLSDFLRLRQLNPVLAATGAAGIQKVKDHLHFDVTLLDIGLPDTSGLDLLDQLTLLQPDTRSVILTGYQDIGVRMSSLEKSASAYITKPFNREELSVALAKVFQEISFEQALNYQKPDHFSIFSYRLRACMLKEILHYRALKNKTSTKEDYYAFLPFLEASNMDIRSLIHV